MLEEKVSQAKRALVLAADMSKSYYGEKLVLTYSGGKDSDVMLHLAVDVLEENDFEVINSHTGVDAPQTVKHIKEVFKQLEERGIQTTIHIPRDKNGKQISMRSLIIQSPSLSRTNTHLRESHDTVAGHLRRHQYLTGCVL